MIHLNMRRTLQAAFATAVLIGGAAMVSCDSVIYDDEGDCSVRFRVPFTYTMNILEADAFSSQVRSVTLYVFDKSGNLVLEKTESGDAVAVTGYKMDVDLSPGRYDMLAWCKGESPMADHTAFEIGRGQHPADFDAVLPLKGTAPGLYSDLDITPLYHGWVTDVVCEDTYGDVDLPAIDLTKDTNVINVILENLDGREMKPSDFTISITGDNSEMDYRNQLAGSTGFVYRPWSLRAVSSQRPSKGRPADDDVTVVTGLFSELTLGRLMVGRAPMLSVKRNTDGTRLFNLNLIDFLLMVKGHYQGHFTNQQYLDRMDQHTLTFFIDADLNWYTANGVLINGWTVVPPQVEEF